MERVLVVDDDPHIREVVCFALQKAGYETTEARDGADALVRFEQLKPDLLVLDIMMPELDGTEVCRRIRQQHRTPIVFLSSKDEEIDRILGLELGGDDYITKPFSPRELVARVKAVLRRGGDAASAHGGSDTAPLRHGQVHLDPNEYRAFWGATEVVLTATEFGILRTLLSWPGKVFTRDALMDGAYDLNRVVSDRTIDSHVRRLRHKFELAGGSPLETVHGVGYKLGPCAATSD